MSVAAIDPTEVRRGPRRRQPLQPGDRFTHWTVVRGDLPDHQALCRCDCGEVRDVFIGNLRHNISRSCGCKRAVWHPCRLTPDIVAAIRASTESVGVLSARYDVSGQTVKHVRSRKTWRWLP